MIPTRPLGKTGTAVPAVSLGGEGVLRTTGRSREAVPVILETMKMETPVVAPEGGTVVTICCAPGALIRAGQPLLALRTD